MKMKKDHYDFIKKQVDAAIEKNPSMYDNYKKRNLSDTRYNWDLLYLCGLTDFICSKLYDYLNDDHINTAIKNITGKKN